MSCANTPCYCKLMSSANTPCYCKLMSSANTPCYCKLMSSANTPCYCKLMSCANTPCYCTLTMVSLPGGELLDRVAADSSWAEGKAAGVVKRLLETLQHVHSLGIVHMDIKVGRGESETRTHTNTHTRTHARTHARTHTSSPPCKDTL